MRGFFAIILLLTCSYCSFAEESQLPDDRTMVLSLLDKLTAGGEVGNRARSILLRHTYPSIAAPILRERLKDPDLPNWVFAIETLAKMSADQMTLYEKWLPQAPPAIKVRYHLWRISRLRTQLWQIPGTSDAPDFAAIQDLGDQAVPELIHALDDPRLVKQAAYCAGLLKNWQVLRHVVDHITDTKVYTAGGRTGPPPRTCSLAAVAIVAQGPEGRRFLLSHLKAMERIDGAAADLILESLEYVGAHKESQATLVSMFRGSAEPSVKEWALNKLVKMSDRENSAQVAPLTELIRLPELISLMEAYDPAGRDWHARRLAELAAQYVSRQKDPLSIDACTRQLERNALVDTILQNTGLCAARFLDSIRYAGLRKRTAEAVIRCCWTNGARASQSKLEILTSIVYYASEESLPTIINYYRDVIITGRYYNENKLQALRSLGEAYRRIECRPLVGEAYARILQHVLDRKDLQEVEKDRQDSYLIRQVISQMPVHVGDRNYSALIGKATQPPMPLSLRDLAEQHLAATGRIEYAERAIVNAGQECAEAYGIYLLPAIVELANGDDAEKANLALAALVDEKKLKRYRPQKPDPAKEALLQLAAKHCTAAIPEHILKAGIVPPATCEAIRIFQMQTLIPELVKLLDKDNVPEVLSYFPLEKQYYDPLFVLAQKRNVDALEALSGTADPRVAELIDIWKNHSVRNRYPSGYLAVALLRIGDSRGIDIAPQVDLGLCKTSAAADAILKHLVDGSNPYDRIETLNHALEQIGKPAVPRICKALADPLWPEGYFHDSIRKQLATVLGNIGDESAVPVLKWMGLHEDETKEIMEALWKIGGDTAIQAVYDLAAAGKALPRGDLHAPLSTTQQPAAWARRFAKQLGADSLRGFELEVWAAKLDGSPDYQEKLYQLWQKTPDWDRTALTITLARMGDKRVEQEAFGVASYPSDMGPLTFEQKVALDREGYLQYAERLFDSVDDHKRQWGIRLLALFGVRNRINEMRVMLHGESRNDRNAAAVALAILKVPGIEEELFSMRDQLDDYYVCEALGYAGTGKAAELLIKWISEPEQAYIDEYEFRRFIGALKRNGQPSALAEARKLLIEKLNSPAADEALQGLKYLADLDKDALRAILVQMAAGQKAHQRCLALYGFIRYYGYKGTYDPFAEGKTLAEGVADLKACFPTEDDIQ